MEDSQEISNPYLPRENIPEHTTEKPVEEDNTKGNITEDVTPMSEESVTFGNLRQNIIQLHHSSTYPKHHCSSGTAMLATCLNAHLKV